MIIIFKVLNMSGYNVQCKIVQIKIEDKKNILKMYLIFKKKINLYILKNMLNYRQLITISYLQYFKSNSLINQIFLNIKLL